MIRFACLVTLLWLIIIVVACEPQGQTPAQLGGPMPERTIEEVLHEHTDSLMAISGVVGTAQGLCNGKPCIRVFVVKNTDELLAQIPPEIEGYPVDVQETGEFRKLDPG